MSVQVGWYGAPSRVGTCAARSEGAAMTTKPDAKKPIVSLRGPDDPAYPPRPLKFTPGLVSLRMEDGPDYPRTWDDTVEQVTELASEAFWDVVLRELGDMHSDESIESFDCDPGDTLEKEMRAAVARWMRGPKP